MTSTVPSMLSFTRSLSPSHMLMYSAKHIGADPKDDLPVTVREEPLRGLNATARTPENERQKAVLQVVESCELAPDHEVLVLKGRLLVKNQNRNPHACNEMAFVALHTKVLDELKNEKGFEDLGLRYAIQLACGGIGWRNHAEAEEHCVTVEYKGTALTFKDMFLDDQEPFSLDTASYEAYRRDLKVLAGWIAEALVRESGPGTHLKLRVEYRMGLGARVYASQEWAAEDFKRASKQRWPGGEGVTRVLAKLRLPNGERQAIINDRKAGNALRVIDDWYPGAEKSRPIAVEPYGASSHEARAYRRTTGSIYELLRRVAAGESARFTKDERMFYAAVCIRGGVFGASSD